MSNNRGSIRDEQAKPTRVTVMTKKNRWTIKYWGTEYEETVRIKANKVEGEYTDRGFEIKADGVTITLTSDVKPDVQSKTYTIEEVL